MTTATTPVRLNCAALTSGGRSDAIAHIAIQSPLHAAAVDRLLMLKMYRAIVAAVALAFVVVVVTGSDV
jgi:hypothetical protein